MKSASPPVSTRSSSAVDASAVAGGAGDSNTAMLGGKATVVVFVFALLSFVVESQLTQYVQGTLGYQRPFLLLYVVHSSFIIIFPIHLFYLVYFSPSSSSYTCQSLIYGLVQSIHEHLSPDDPILEKRISTDHTNDCGINASVITAIPRMIILMTPKTRSRFLWLAAGLTAGITVPALLWFIAISLASVTDVTAIWNANAFFAYFFTVKCFHLRFEARKLAAVVIATLGTLLVVYGSGSNDTSPTSTIESLPSSPSFASPLIGNLLTLIASVGYGLYQVLYRKYAALSNDPELTSERQQRSSSSAYVYERLETSLERESIPILVNAGASSSRLATLETENVEGMIDEEPRSVTDIAIPSPSILNPPPFGLHPNLLTSFIGLFTLLLGPIILPLLHITHLEPFLLPSSPHAIITIACIALSGVLFNAGFMILLGVWGPIVVSVGNLMTIVLVFVSDEVWGRGEVRLLPVVGSTVIVCAFGVLVWDFVWGEDEGERVSVEGG